MFDDSFKARYSTLPVAAYTHTRRPVASSFAAHNHREIELIAMTAGKADVFVGAVAFSLTAGDLLVIPPYCVHYAKIAPETSYECLCFDPALLCDTALCEGEVELAVLQDGYILIEKRDAALYLLVGPTASYRPGPEVGDKLGFCSRIVDGALYRIVDEGAKLLEGSILATRTVCVKLL